MDLQELKRQAVLDYLGGNQEAPEIPTEYGEEAKKANLISGLGQALEGFARAGSVARGGAGVDTGFYEGIAKAGAAKDQAKRQAVLEKLKQQRLAKSDQLGKIETLGKLSGMQREDEQAAREQEQATREQDPSSQESLMYQELAGKFMPGKNFSGVPASLIKQKLPFLQKMYDMDLRSKERQDRIARQEAQDKATQDYRQRSLELQEAGLAGREEERKERIARQERQESRGNESQNKANAFANRIEQAESVFEELDKAGFERSSYFEATKAALTPDAFLSDEMKRQSQAERNFVNAVLREESGAAIAPSEFESAEKQYFPRAGDSKEVLKQKRLNRKIVLESLKQEAGPAYRPIFGELETEKKQQPQLSKKDKAALDWANTNPNDPRAEQIKEKIKRSLGQ